MTGIWLASPAAPSRGAIPCDGERRPRCANPAGLQDCLRRHFRPECPLIRALIEPLLRQYGQATVHSAPTTGERLFGHGVYLASLGVLASLGAGFVTQGGRPGMILAIKLASLVTALVYLSLIWSIRYRRVPPDTWFVSHLLWLCFSYAFALGAALLAALGLAIGLLLVLAIPPVAVAVVYGPIIAAALVALWFGWRVLRGYAAYWRALPVGGWSREPVQLDAQEY